MPLVGGYRGSSGRGLSPPRAESSGATAASLAAHAPRRIGAANSRGGPQPAADERAKREGIERITGTVRRIEPS